MLTLTTGGPGTGKTAFLVAELIKIHEQQPYREFFIHGIKEFKAFKHTTIYCKSPLCDLCRSQELPDSALYVEEWPDWYKSHFYIVIDEVQRIWGQSNGANKTDAISRLQTHRHYGLDFWLVSQSPKLIHTDVKAMVGRHIHLESKWSGRKQFEWSEVRDNTLSRTDAVVRPYTLPRHVFKLYKSAEVHTVQVKRKPIAFYASIIALIVIVTFGIAIYLKVSAKQAIFRQNEAIKEGVVGAGVGGALAPPAPAPTTNDVFIPLDTPEHVAQALTPVVPTLPWTAPIYRAKAITVTYPRVTMCWSSPDKCSCYSEQGTQIDMPDTLCRASVQRRTYNMFKDHDVKTNVVDKQNNTEESSPESMQAPQNFLTRG